jgi:protein tyrosine/serine phosphatase
MADVSATTVPAWIDFEGVVNARDLGGLPTVDGRTTRRGVLFRTAHLQTVTAADRARLIDELGLRTVLDLRTDGERESEGPGPLADLAHHHALSLVAALRDPANRGRDRDRQQATAQLHVESEPADAVERPAEKTRAARMATHYIGYLTELPHNFATALRLIADPASGPTLVHCAAGKDRTGTVCAVALSLAGVTREAVLDDYVASAERIQDVLESLSASPTYRVDLSTVDAAAISPQRESMAAFLDHLDQAYGGVHGLAMSLGVDEETVASLGRRLVGSSRS